MMTRSLSIRSLLAKGALKHIRPKPAEIIDAAGGRTPQRRITDEVDLLRKSGELLMRQEEFSGHEAEAVHEGI
jgi:hypothetical protein